MRKPLQKGTPVIQLFYSCNAGVDLLNTRITGGNLTSGQNQALHHPYFTGEFHDCLKSTREPTVLQVENSRLENSREFTM